MSTHGMFVRVIMMGAAEWTGTGVLKRTGMSHQAERGYFKEGNGTPSRKGLF
jgi:hypothetical protein